MCVIGSGPVGASVAAYLLDMKYEVTMIDDSDCEPSTNYEGFLPIREHGVTDRVGLDLSNEFGGFSNKWGGVISNNKEIDKNNFKELDKYFGIFTPEYIKGCNCRIFSKVISKDITLDIWDALIATENNKETIWNSRAFLIDSLKKETFFRYFNKTRVDSIERTSDGLNIKINGINEVFDYVLVCAGPIGNAILKLKIGKTHKITISDTQMLYIPFLSRHKNIKSSCERISCSQVVSILAKSVNHQACQVQMYSHIYKYAERISKILKFNNPKIIRKILKVLDGHLFVALMYLPEEISEKIIIEKNSNEIQAYKVRNRSLRKDKRVYLRKLKEVLQMESYLMFPRTAYATNVGKSYHLGKHQEHVLIGENADLNSTKNIFFYGTSEFLTLKPGAVTFEAIQFSLEKLRRDLNLPKI